MQLQDFDYNLPKELIAQYPLKDRCSSRLMVLDRENKTISHKNFSDITQFFQEGDCLVLNDTRVIPARLIGKRASGGKVEVFIVAQNARRSANGLVADYPEDNYFNVLMRPLKKLKIGEEIYFDNGLKAEIITKDKVKFNTHIFKKIYKAGQVPLPPYIKHSPNATDKKRYQTVFAKKDGAIAAPTAGLHFDKKILNAIKVNGTGISFITLHVGLGTFKPIISENISDHKMDFETYSIPKNTLKLIMRANRVFACGTTVTRALEAAYQNKQLSSKTNLFIYPGFKFNVVDSIITNFHLPKSTLFLLVCAFAGRDFIMRAYQEAIENKYRFYSYGDCMLII
ncbi:MAG: tRNA preQ1(34) S-adenosylmethionine ribosyltransferase-isomerase QueA [Candidatus Omnitrophota bacterium]